MKTLFKLVLVVIAVAFAISVLRPETPVGEFVSAAVEDAASFCDRRPQACQQGAEIAYTTGDLVSEALRSILNDGTEGQSELPLTGEDKRLAPATASQQQPAIAAHGNLPRP
ncbi:DUF5330 domain-containing protein [Acuticoccus sp. MNP-M23]|uniref:DUF5330 domain-containing protein n=1 Tax=Acuticoccus sp. MNP-M23 TaxID=3072793 RepID=UPI0028153F32|nr:DUF5330 domain-containing protein [Acuticoccus sp. MNP-M23]WMS41683.1 DUF5330 domain-containing protein [Acuticoccus sp. MNP-M23]